MPFRSDSIGYGESALCQFHRRKTAFFATRSARMIRRKDSRIIAN